MKTVAVGLWSLAVAFALGAFGTHSLKDRLTPDLLEVFRTGQVYQVYVSLALVGIGLAADRTGGNLRWPVRLVCAGGLVFSGSLYVLALSGVRVWGAVTPLGGVFLLVGTAWAATVLARRTD
ncbi:MAG: DUF423 domain-containing protein [Armatimonadetes bacterium]|nr:DUF423 domain-containing protein [Armatimonadota bacterium]